VEIALKKRNRIQVTLYSLNNICNGKAADWMRPETKVHVTTVECCWY
jgi:hypothetical protein